jgi:excinuclease ABC subunit A
LVFAGDYKELKDADTLTSKYLTGRLEIEVPEKRRKVKNGSI